MHFKMLSTICFNLDQSKISGNGLINFLRDKSVPSHFLHIFKSFFWEITYFYTFWLDKPTILWFTFKILLPLNTERQKNRLMLDKFRLQRISFILLNILFKAKYINLVGGRYSILTLYHTILTYNDPGNEAFRKHCRKRRKWW